MNVSRRVLVWSAVLLCGCGSTLRSIQPSKSQPQTRDVKNRQAMIRYSIEAELLGMQGEIRGSQEVYFHNRTSSKLDRLLGFIALRDAKLASKDCVVKSAEPKGALKNIEEGRVFQFLLNPAIEPGETQKLSIEFSGVIPRDEVYASGAVSARFWHPCLFTPISSEADWSKLFPPATFEVILIVPSGHNVATSAERMRESPGRDGRKRIEAYAQQDRFFKWRSSLNYYVASSRSPGGEIRVYFTDKEALQGPFVAKVASEISSFYTDLLGSFPFPLVSFVPGRADVSGGGEAGPRMLMLHQMHLLAVPGSGKDLTQTRWIVAHELGHLYWSSKGYVQIKSHLGWLELGLGMRTDQQYAKSIGMKYTVPTEAHSYIAAAKAGYNTTIHQSEEQLENAPFDVNHVIRHGKGFAVVSMLEYLMGEQKFLRLMKTILARYGGRTDILTEKKFCLLAQKHYGVDLRWFFEQWLDTNKALDYGVGGVSEDHDRLTVKVRRLGEAVMPVVVQVVTEKGNVLRKRAGGQAEVETICFDKLDSPWLEIVLDPAERLPDLDRANNVVRNSKK